MHIIKLDLKNCSISIDSISIKNEKDSIPINFIAKLCTPPALPTQGISRYHLSRKVSFCGQSADGVIEIGEETTFSLTLIFDLIEFFKTSILESRIIKACEKSLNSKFESNHPSTAFLDFFPCGRAIFFYDAKQGDLSLEIKLQGNSDVPRLQQNLLK